MGANEPIAVNGRKYAWPERPTVIVCIDGSEPAYMDAAIEAGAMPWLRAARSVGSDNLAAAVVPSFTNPNNMSIVTGVPPAVHGISGNFFLDPDTGEEVMMNDPAHLRVGTIHAAFSRAGAKVAVVTAKDKLRSMLGHGWQGIAFSAEKASEATKAANGIEGVLDFVGLPQPSVYSAAVSEFLFAAGVRLMETERPDLMYLSTTDYIQHKHAPGTKEANDFYAMMDRYWRRLDELGAVIVLTADHGMNAKFGEDGQPKVIYLQTLLDERFGAEKTRVILPITDPYVVHHGALGSFATAYLNGGVTVDDVIARLKDVPGIDLALTRAEAAGRFELPADRIGDVVIVSARDTVLGTGAERHDLSGLDAPLRSHGGVTEQTVPLIVSRPTPNLSATRRLRNFDAFDLALNEAR
ncbi:MAG: phosphonoacetate hydrolase [Rhodospirillales bacterium]